MVVTELLNHTSIFSKEQLLYFITADSSKFVSSVLITVLCLTPAESG